MIFVGVDLAWSPHRASGLVAVHWEAQRLRTLWARQLPHHEAVLTFLLNLKPVHRYGLLIDAPLRGTGPFRPAEHALMPLLRPWKVGLLPFCGVSFEHLLVPLQHAGFRLYPPDSSRLCQVGGWIVEVYPQATAVGVVRQRLPYKRGDRARRRLAWRRFLQRVARRLSPWGLAVETPESLEPTHLRDAWVAAMGGAVACALGCGRRFPETPGEPYLWVPWLPDAEEEPA